MNALLQCLHGVGAGVCEGAKMMSRVKIWRGVVLALAVVVLAATGYWLWSRAPAGLPEGFVSGNGRVEATEADVASKLAGRVTEMLVQEGDKVAQGAVVARLDTADLQAQWVQAQAEVKKATDGIAEADAGVARNLSELALSKATLARTEELVARRFLSAQRLDADRAAVAVAKAGLQLARAKVDSSRSAKLAAEAAQARVEALLADGVLTAPLAGRVLYRLVEPGEVVGAGGKVLTLVDLSDVYMTVFIASQQAGRLEIGGEARILPDAWGGEAIPARVSFIADKAQFTPREVETRSEREKLMFRVKLRVEPEWLAAHGERIKPGMAGEAVLRLDASQPWPVQLQP